MARKKTEPDIMPLEMLQAMGAMDMDAEAMFENVMEMESQLIEIAHSISSEAINIHGFDTEKERVAAAHRQVELLGELYKQLRDVTNPDLH
jgi:uncharacterized protein with HEPN domain